MRPGSDESDGEFDDPVSAADAEADRRVLGWGGKANPNTADGQIQGMTAFADAAVNANGCRCRAARPAACLALLFIAAYVLLALAQAAKLL